MARVRYGGGITAITGSIGGWTFQSNRSGSIIRMRGWPPKSWSNNQNTARNLHQYFIWSWQQLNLGQKATWDVLASAHTKINKFGQTKTLSGFNWFESINFARLKCGLSELTEAPTYSAPSSVPSYQLLITNEYIKVYLASPQTITDNYLFIRATMPISQVSTSFNRFMRLIKVVQSDVFDTVDVTSDWESYFGLTWSDIAASNNCRIGVMLQTVDINSGVTSEGTSFVNAPSGGIGYMQIGTTFRIY